MYYFNPRSREGSDDRQRVLPGILPKFQSTLPRGERQVNYEAFFLCLTFQSTLPRGERQEFRDL